MSSLRRAAAPRPTVVHARQTLHALYLAMGDARNARELGTEP